MTTSLSSALTLMVIGMITVFLVLFLVYLTGNLLISAINRWLPAPVVEVNQKVRQSEISTSKVAAITAAVEIFSGGTARVTKIEKE
jgi:oxaloacetate decarboxylase gamma subunit